MNDSWCWVGTATVALGTGETAATTEADVVVAVTEGGTSNENHAYQSNMARQAKLMWIEPKELQARKPFNRPMEKSTKPVNLIGQKLDQCKVETLKKNIKIPIGWSNQWICNWNVQDALITSAIKIPNLRHIKKDIRMKERVVQLSLAQLKFLSMKTITVFIIFKFYSYNLLKAVVLGFCLLLVLGNIITYFSSWLIYQSKLCLNS